MQVQRFKDGMQSVDTALKLGLSTHVATLQCINSIEVVIPNNCHIKLKQLATEINLTFGSITHDELGFHKCVKFILGSCLHCILHLCSNGAAISCSLISYILVVHNISN
jgi:hypothetical protein